MQNERFARLLEHFSHSPSNSTIIVFNNTCFCLHFIYSLVNQTMADLDVGRVRQILSEALDVWSSGSRLTFREQLSDKADIQVLFAR